MRSFSDKFDQMLQFFPFSLQFSLQTSTKMSYLEPHINYSRSTVVTFTFVSIYRDDPIKYQHAHKGLFVGLLLVMATLVALTVFHSYLQRNDQVKALTFFQVADIVLLMSA